VNYNYDALGRLMLRDDSTSTTVKYWLGLAPLAEELLGSESGRNLAVFRPNPETAGGPYDAGWGDLPPFDFSRNLEYMGDGERPSAILAECDGDQANVGFIIGDDDAGTLNTTPNTSPWHDTQRRHLSLWLRNWSAIAPCLTALLTTTDTQQVVRQRALQFPLDDGAPGWSDGEPCVPVGAQFATNQWHYLELDLSAELHKVLPGETITKINGLEVWAAKLRLADIVLSGGVCKRSYEVVPGAAIGGVLGSWTGPNVVADNGNRVRYFHYNDLGTVLAQTKADGTMEGLWQPDFFGNYCDTSNYTDGYAYPGSPDRPELGLTGKQYDLAIGGYPFFYREEDPERGRWTGEDPLGNIDGNNKYVFVKNDPVNHKDQTGASIINWIPIPGINQMLCMSAIYDEVNNKYSGDDPYDSFKHCLVSCRAMRECGLYGFDPTNFVWIYWGGYLHELSGNRFSTSFGQDEQDDMEANKYGIKYSACKKQTCLQVCATKYPNKLK
jgi:RHS repeat-associated protein